MGASEPSSSAFCANIELYLLFIFCYVTLNQFLIHNFSSMNDGRYDGDALMMKTKQIVNSNNKFHKWKCVRFRDVMYTRISRQSLSGADRASEHGQCTQNICSAHFLPRVPRSLRHRRAAVVVVFARLIKFSLALAVHTNYAVNAMIGHTCLCFVVGPKTIAAPFSHRSHSQRFHFDIFLFCFCFFGYLFEHHTRPSSTRLYITSVKQMAHVR